MIAVKAVEKKMEICHFFRSNNRCPSKSVYLGERDLLVATT